MSNYYSSVILLVWIALGALSILIAENDRITRKGKRSFYLTYSLVALSALAEWTGIQLSGNTAFPGWLLAAVKCADYILTPMAGGALIEQMNLRNRWRSVILGILLLNTVFQIVSCFTGWMVIIDEQNRYSHGPLYAVYMVFYLAVIVLIVVEFMIYGNSFRRKNRGSLYAIMTLVLTGTLLQELVGGDCRTAYLAITMGASLMFIHYTEFTQLSSDDYIVSQRIQIMTDALTGVQSRHAYTKAMKDYSDAGVLPQDLCAFTIDINGLKTVNDTNSHEAGDELICGAARCIEKAFGISDRCFRTGGDEFVVLANMPKEKAAAAVARLHKETAGWTGEQVKELTLSVGYACAADHPGFTAEKLVREADLAMYVAKSDYYRRTGHDRRKEPR